MSMLRSVRIPAEILNLRFTIIVILRHLSLPFVVEVSEIGKGATIAAPFGF
jgi:hypothetical protein